MWIIGLTGAMGSGKSTLAEQFLSLGVPVCCADKEIHILLDEDQEIQEKIKNFWPDVLSNGKIDRLLLGNKVLESTRQLRILEGILYPKLAQRQKDFLKHHQALKTPLVVLDVPLLLEVGLNRYCHRVVLAEAPYSLRKKRVLKRGGVSETRFKLFESHQFTEEIRRKYADIIIPTGRGKESSLQKVKDFLFHLSKETPPSWTGKWPKTLKRQPYGQRNCP